eukprot:PhF_6_TR41122/c0_g1_i1/m.62278/K03926/cutA; periplasmic divalent cation tolerance protein
MVTQPRKSSFLSSMLTPTNILLFFIFLTSLALLIQNSKHQQKEQQLQQLMTTPALRKFSVCWITAPNVGLAESIAQHLVENRLVACVNIVPNITSVYSWKGAVQKDTEVLMMAKTQTVLVPRVIQAVKTLHTYEVPEVISVELGEGLPAYLDWIAASTGDIPTATEPTK